MYLSRISLLLINKTETVLMIPGFDLQKVSIKTQNKVLREEISIINTKIGAFEGLYKSISVHQAKSKLLHDCFRKAMDIFSKFNEKFVTNEVIVQIAVLSKYMDECNTFIHLIVSDKWKSAITSSNLLSQFNRFHFVYFHLTKLCFLIDPKSFVDISSLISCNIEDIKDILNKVDQAKHLSLISEFDMVLLSKQDRIDEKEYSIQRILKISKHSIVYSIIGKNNKTKYSLIMFDPCIDPTTFRYRLSIMKRLDHPSIVKLYSFNQLPPYSFLVSSTDFPTLQSFVNTPDCRLSPTIKSTYILQIARSLEYLHARRIVHRKISSKNILITSENTILLSGFSHSRQKNSQMTGSIHFTPYCAPETVIEPIVFDEKVDVYSFGVLFWEVCSQNIPFDTIHYDIYYENILSFDFRPLLNDKHTEISGFLTRLWSRNPKYRPSFSDIVTIFDSGNIVVPETDMTTYSSYINATKTKHQSTLKGIHSLTPSLLLQMSQTDVDDFLVELVVNVLTESSTGELKSTADSIFQQKIKNVRNLSSYSLVLMIQLISTYSWIESFIVQSIQELSNTDEITRDLFDRLPVDHAVPFFVKHIMKSEKDATFLLQYCSKKSDSIVTFVADSVASSFPGTDILYKVAKQNHAFYKRSLQLMVSSSADHLKRYFQYIIQFSRDNIATFSPALNTIAGIIGPAIIQYDKEGELIIQLFRNGYIKIIIDLCSDETFSLFFLEKMFNIVSAKAVDVIRIIVRISHHMNLREKLFQYPVFDLFIEGLRAKEFEYVGNAFLIINPDLKELDAHHSFANHAVGLLSECDDSLSASSLLSALIPYALKTNWIDTRVVPSTIISLIKSNDTVVASRALGLGVIVSQKPRIGKLFASADTVEAVLRFIGCKNNAFEYIALRFIASISSFINEQSLPNEIIEASLSIVETRDNERLLEIAIVILATIPKEHIALHLINVIEKIRIVKKKFPLNEKITKSLEVLEKKSE